MTTQLYPNECVKRIVAFVPEGHLHARFMIEFCDKTIILHEATVAGLVRAFALVALHPQRRAAELTVKHLSEDEKKPVFAEWQLLETDRDEQEVLREAEEKWKQSTIPECCTKPTPQRESSQ
ncbi:hypothetical protein PYJP_00210 [Pyrofollis japonicus]|uniref:hypothetical protein n=1 Tax=Pyrofollis japonicus TaxID=3060460 RepID=UPI00295B8193|nr:hypothetical protein [Pyrofollis japonicus]BEP16669.1 hypothetical protein PYJP_00210 [Pyrofollis japonicus]